MSRKTISIVVVLAIVLVVVAAVVLAIVVPLPGDGTRHIEAMTARFVEQVEANTCDEASGFDIDDATWTAACNATVDDIGDGKFAPVELSESGAVSIPYVDKDGFEHSVGMSFRTDLFDFRARLERIYVTGDAFRFD